jgi:hypothetical protein
MVKKHHGLGGSKATVRWCIPHLKGTPTKFLGYVGAPDEDSDRDGNERIQDRRGAAG